ncbi:methyltransferase family protein [Marinoscillum furvescens]|uniref:Protein-S-isoprenylcysteine O-methyltransferase Ste14 n=1 Tax=Marinoscillum furvescens DSM 4134 TaxID=1122208 RepID=A0A3D9LKV3_MARFU|nr:isoprenylcysteine carboxylmethyltransferase family protein [Marinoscillum furvescens]REE05892.1 protein-S-isoprenylcysteine O-methyltransferase Ste14 [Marinoscillum furvescens DSM 4134]
MHYLILIIGAWAGYLLLHSLLAADRIKAAVPLNAQVYRLFYSLVSVAGLLGLLYLMALAPAKLLFTPPGWMRYGAMIFASWGVIIVMVSFRHLSMLSFLGLKKEPATGLVREGIHGYVRHPIYSGTILVLIGMVGYHPTDVNVATVLTVFAYLPLGIRWEEQKLLKQYGQAYEQYKKEVPAIVPGRG